MYVQVYREPAWVRFYAHPLSLACLFRILGSAACVVLAILATISSGDVWLKRKVGTYQAHVDFLYNAMIRVTDSTGTKTWTTDPAANQLLGAQSGLGMLQVTAMDEDHDGVTDLFRVQFGISNVEQAVEADILLEFSYNIEADVRLDVPAIVHVQHSSATPGSALEATGRLALMQGAPLGAGSSWTDARARLLNKDEPDRLRLGRTSVFDVASALSSAQSKPLYAELADQHVLWKPLGRLDNGVAGLCGSSMAPSPPRAQAGQGRFVASIDVHVPAEQPLLYRPRGLSELKWGFVQCLGIFVILYAVFGRVEALFFQYRVLDTISTSDTATTCSPF